MIKVVKQLTHFLHKPNYVNYFMQYLSAEKTPIAEIQLVQLDTMSFEREREQL